MNFNIEELIKTIDQNVKELKADPNRPNAVLDDKRLEVDCSTKSNGKIPMPKPVDVEDVVSRLSNDGRGG